MKPDFYLHKYGWSSAVFLVSSSSFIFCLRTKPLPTLKVHWCLHCFREKICKKFWNGSFSSFYTHRDVWNKGFFSAKVWGYMCCFRTNDVWCNLSSYNGNSCIRPMIHHFQSNFRLAHLILMSIFWEKKKLHSVYHWRNCKPCPLLDSPKAAQLRVLGHLPRSPDLKSTALTMTPQLLSQQQGWLGLLLSSF